MMTTSMNTATGPRSNSRASTTFAISSHSMNNAANHAPPPSSATSAGATAATKRAIPSSTSSPASNSPPTTAAVNLTSGWSDLWSMATHAASAQSQRWAGPISQILMDSVALPLVSVHPPPIDTGSVLTSSSGMISINRIECASNKDTTMVVNA